MVTVGMTVALWDGCRSRVPPARLQPPRPPDCHQAPRAWREWVAFAEPGRGGAASGRRPVRPAPLAVPAIRLGGQLRNL